MRRIGGSEGWGGGPGVTGGSGVVGVRFPPGPPPVTTSSVSGHRLRRDEAAMLEECERDHREQRVVVQPESRTALEVIEPEFVLQLLVRLLTAPAGLNRPEERQARSAPDDWSGTISARRSSVGLRLRHGRRAFGRFPRHVPYRAIHGAACRGNHTCPRGVPRTGGTHAARATVGTPHCASTGTPPPSGRSGSRRECRESFFDAR